MIDEENVSRVTKPKSPKMRALKEFHICHPPHFDLNIKEGDDLSEVPEEYHQNLKTEGVI